MQDRLQPVNVRFIFLVIDWLGWVPTGSQLMHGASDGYFLLHFVDNASISLSLSVWFYNESVEFFHGFLAVLVT